MSYTVKPFEELDIMDDFLMNATAGDREVGEEFYRTLLRGLLQRELGKVQISIQKVIFANAPNLEYENGLFFIYFNTTGTKGGNSSMKSLLNFIQNSKINNVKDEITHRLHNCISKVKISPEVREAYMRWEEKLFYERLDGRIEKETDLEQIKKWFKAVLKSNSIEEFIEKM